MIRPLKKRVLISPKEAETQTLSGLYLPSIAQGTDNITEGVVLAVGNEVAELKEGDQVLYAKHTGAQVESAGEKLLLIEEDAIIGVIEKD